MKTGRVQSILLALRAWTTAGAVVVAVAIAPAPVCAGDTLLWAVLDFPPFQILDGEHRNTGSFDGLLDLMIRQLPDLEHNVVAMSFARREEEIRQGSRLCTPGLFRTPAREKLLVFSRPALIHLDNRLVIRAARANLVDSGHAVDLASLLANRELVGGVITDRSFAPNIDPLLQQHAQAPNVVMRSVKSSQMFEMLMKGEIDYTILFPHEAAYLVRKLGRPDDIRTLPIAATPAYIFTHVACTRGEWGEGMITRIDRILQAQMRTPEYRALSERWYDESDKALIRRYYPQLLAPSPPRQ